MKNLKIFPNPQSHWSSYLDKQTAFPSFILDKWIRPLKCARFDNNAVILEASDQFFRQWVIDNYYETLVRDLIEMAGRQLRVEIKIEEYSLADDLDEIDGSLSELADDIEQRVKTLLVEQRAHIIKGLLEGLKRQQLRPLKGGRK